MIDLRIDFFFGSSIFLGGLCLLVASRGIFFFQRRLPDFYGSIKSSRLVKKTSCFMLVSGSTITLSDGLATKHLSGVCEQSATNYLMATHI